MNRYDITSEKAFDIIYDKYRMKLINAFGSRENMTATFKQIADQLGDNSSKVTYHGKMLISIDLLVLDHTETINGIVAKYYRLVSDNFRIRFGSKDSDVVNMKIMKSQADMALDSLEQAKEKMHQIDPTKRSIAFAMNDIYLTEEESKELWSVVEKFNNKKERKKGAEKVTFYTLIMHEKGNDSCMNEDE